MKPALIFCAAFVPTRQGRFLVLAATLTAYVFLAGAPAQAQGFLSAIDDMPLAAGMEEIADGALVFDKPEGRIVQVTALHDARVTPADIRDFYLATLPNLGWRPVTQKTRGLTFTRKGEILRITVTADLVIFDLAPAK